MASNFGNKIKKLRARHRWSQFTLEMEAGFSPGTVSRIENGKVNPTKETLFKIAMAMRLNLEEATELFNLVQICSLSKPLAPANDA